MNRFAIKNGLLQSDLDFAGFKRLNDATPGGGGGGSAIGPKTYDLKADFGANGNGVQVYDAVMTSGSSTLTSASNPWVAGDVGKIIVVVAAGAGGHDLVTTITGFTNAGTVTLGAPAAASISGEIATFGSDNTAALQSAINAVATGGGKIFAPEGIYILSGALQTVRDGKTYNAQITLPFVPVMSAPSAVLPHVITIEGEIPGGVAMSMDKLRKTGSIFFSTVTGSGTRPSCIGGPQIDALSFPANFTAVALFMKNLEFRCYDDPSITMLDMLTVFQFCLDSVTIEPDSIIRQTVSFGTATFKQPTHTDSVGIIFPGHPNASRNYWRNVDVAGFYTGVQMQEGMSGDNNSVALCFHGILLNTGDYNYLNKLTIFGCPYGLVGGNGPCYIDFGHISTEKTANPSWATTVYDLYDPAGFVHGHAAFHCYDDTIPGRSAVWTQSPGAVFAVTSQDAQVTMIGPKARLVPIPGGPGGLKIQVQNSSNVWEDADSWVASS